MQNFFGICFDLCILYFSEKNCFLCRCFHISLVVIHFKAQCRVLAWVVLEEKSESDTMFSGLALFSASNQSNIKKYIFCNQENHKSHQPKNSLLN